jgi:CDP-archaeol synthase
MPHIDPFACALFLMSAFVLAGFAQLAWFATAASQNFAVPLDGGRTLGDRPILGAHKTLRGFVVMVPAAAVAFALVARVAGAGDADSGLWPLTWLQYALLGAWAGFGFMAGELPNSFAKRQLGIAPGAAVRHPIGQVWQFVFDRLDSGIGMLLATSLLVPIRWQTWALVLSIGPLLHWSFSVLLFRLRLKARPA